MSGSTAFALIERLPATVVGSPAAGTRQTMYTQIVKEVPIRPGPHNVAITFFRDGGTSSADYTLDGVRVACVEEVGIPLDVQRFRGTGIDPSLGAGDQFGSPIDPVTIGHGLCSLVGRLPLPTPRRAGAVGVDPDRRADLGQGAGATFDGFVVTIDDRG